MEDVQVIESFCVNCEENGSTRLLLTKIPYFQDIIISSFECPHCHYTNNEVQMAGGIKAQGERIELTVHADKDLNRQLIKSEFATVRLPALDFEIPPQTQKGVASTVQGIISQAATNLSKDQPVRLAMEPEIGAAIAKVITHLESLAAGEVLPFTIIVDDPAGNSFIENPLAPASDPNLKSIKYERTREQTHQLGFYEEQSAEDKPGADLPDELKAKKPVWDLSQPVDDQDNVLGESGLTFQFECAHCGKQGSQNMCEVDIPGFRRCIIMAFVCEHCGARSNEVKAGGAFGEKARKWTLTVESKDDLNRDVLKSDCAALSIPELDLVLEAGTLGGVFTTVEGLLLKIADQLAEQNPFVGDSVLPEQRARMTSLISKLKEFANGRSFPFTVVLDDAADHSHIGRRGADIFNLVAKAGLGSRLHDDKNDSGKDSHNVQEVDHQLTIVAYPRTAEQDDELGLADMKVDNYAD